MPRKALWRVSVRTTLEAEDAVADLLQVQFGQPATSYEDLGTAATQVSVFLETRPRWTLCRRQLTAGLDGLRGCGLNLGAERISLARVPPQDWAESWKRHFKPVAIGSRLLVKPTWAKLRARKGQLVVLLDPGLSFGTGQHPTTSFCLRELVAHRVPAKRQAFLDVGTGSGILAIAAAGLGYGPIEAWDVDPEALAAARGNAALNSVPSRIRFVPRDLAKAPQHSSRRFSVVCANLTSDLLLKHIRKLTNGLKPDGVLVLAGILRSEFGAIQKTCRSIGLRLTTSRAEGEWRSGTFRIQD